MKKRLLFIISLVFILTGCTANYELTYKNGVFEEKITVYEDKEISSHEELPSITKIEKDSDRVLIDGSEHYNVEHSTDGDKNVLTLSYKYDKLSLKQSLVYNECFSEKSFVENDDSIYIKLGGEVTCEYLENAKITFKTDKSVIDSNATKKDKNKGVYTWDSIPKDGITLEISKKNIKKDANLIAPIIRIIIVVVLLGVGIFILKKYNGVEE